jgi:membrane-bound serine protease (ClpP class)
VAAFFLQKHLRLVPALHGIVLAPPESVELPATTSETARPSLTDLIGQEGTTITPLRPAGKARFQDQSFDVFAEGSYIAPGKTVRVVEVSGRRLMVVETEEMS